MTRPVRLEDLDRDPGGRRRAPSVARNRDDVLGVLRRVLPDHGAVLEVASGTGEHVVHFARAFPELQWQPSDRDAEALASIRAWRAHAALDNVLEPVELDIEQAPWPVAAVDAVVAINLAHISPWSTTLGLVRGAAQALSPPGTLFLYGAFFRHGHPTAPSNVDFDAELRDRDPALGVRQLEDLVDAGAMVGLAEVEVVAMPNNNLAVVLRRSNPSAP